MDSFNSSLKNSLFLVRYKFKGSVLYDGNGYAGHYIAKRAKTNGFILDETRDMYIFNDSRIEDKKIKTDFEEKIFLY
jgi:ubiquitin C-terminal hydrolase